jgi:hypothetical protein
MLALSTGKKRSGKEFGVLVFVEPRALDVEQPQSWDEARERQCVDRELRDRFVRAGVRLVVEDVDSAVPDLEEVEVAGNDARGAGTVRRNFDAQLPFERGDVVFAQPDGDLDRDSDTVIAEHKPLQRLMPELVVAYGWNDECSCLRRCIFLAVHDDTRDVRPRRRGLRSACLGVVVAAEEVVRASGRDVFEKLRDGRKVSVARTLLVE